AAQQLGGGQERERRSGTQDVVGAAGFALAAERAAADREDLVLRARAWRDRLAGAITSSVPGAIESAAPSVRSRVVSRDPSSERENRDTTSKCLASCHELGRPGPETVTRGEGPADVDRGH